jgi:hypothetical protein
VDGEGSLIISALVVALSYMYPGYLTLPVDSYESSLVHSRLYFVLLFFYQHCTQHKTDRETGSPLASRPDTMPHPADLPAFTTTHTAAPRFVGELCHRSFLGPVANFQRQDHTKVKVHAHDLTALTGPAPCFQDRIRETPRDHTPQHGVPRPALFWEVSSLTRDKRRPMSDPSCVAFRSSSFAIFIASGQPW